MGPALLKAFIPFIFPSWSRRTLAAASKKSGDLLCTGPTSLRRAASSPTGAQPPSALLLLTRDKDPAGSSPFLLRALFSGDWQGFYSHGFSLFLVSPLASWWSRSVGLLGPDLVLFSSSLAAAKPSKFFRCVFFSGGSSHHRPPWPWWQVVVIWPCMRRSLPDLVVWIKTFILTFVLINLVMLQIKYKVIFSDSASNFRHVFDLSRGRFGPCLSHRDMLPYVLAFQNVQN